MLENKMTKSEIHSIQVALCVDFDFYSAKAINSSKKKKKIRSLKKIVHTIP